MTFSSLLDAALAGTQRHDPPAAIEALNNAPRESRLLRGASIEGLRRLAGQRPAEAPAAQATQAPAESRPVPPIAAVGRLAELLEHRQDLLVEWLELAHLRGYRVPHVWLVDLLEIAGEDAEIANLMEAVGGERLAWLAAHNPAWAFAERIDPDEAYSDGSSEQRVRALQRIRRAEPERGRAVLEESWPSESAEMRARLLAVLEEGLHAADEPLLQRAITDSRKEVRDLALRLIRQLPDSTFGRRWTERARQVLVVKKGLLSTSIEVRQPATFDPTWGDDGVEVRAPKGVGQAGWWLRQMMALTPPGIWPDAALQPMQKSDWASVLVPGLAEAAIAYRHADWCEVLLIAWTGAGRGRAQLGIEPQQMVAALPPARAESILRRIYDMDPAAMASLVGSVRPWSEAFSRFVLEHLLELADKVPYLAGGVMRIAARRADPRLLAVAVALAEREPEQRSLADLAETLEHRAMMRRELG